MNNFKLIVKSFIGFIAVVTIIICIIMTPLKLGMSGYDDSMVRKNMSGSIDSLFCGASFAVNAFVPNIYDQQMDTVSYNLSGFRISFSGRYELLKKEIERNAIKTVYLEIACDTFVRDPEEEKAKGESMTICRLDTISEKTNYFLNNVLFVEDGIDIVSSTSLGYGISGWISMLTKSVPDLYYNRGHWIEPSTDVSLKGREEIQREYYRKTISEYWYEEYLDGFNQIVELCKDNNIDLTIVVTPLSDAYLWHYNNMDNFHSNLAELCSKNGIELLDFNLLKSRWEYFDDASSYCNETHMSEEGAKTFTRVFAEICKKRQTHSTDDLFFSTYDEMIQYSPYTENLNQSEIE